MWVQENIVKKNPELFTFLPAKELHLHDHFLDKTILRLIPRSVTPNMVSFSRVLATPIVFLLIEYNYFRTGIIAFLLVAFTDALDGSLARTRNQITRFGMLFDPLADKLLICSMVLLIVFQNFDFWLGIAVLGVEIIIIVSALVAKYKFRTVRMANMWGKTKMLLQVCAVFITLVAMVLNVPYLFTAAAHLFGLAVIFALVSLFSQSI